MLVTRRSVVAAGVAASFCAWGAGGAWAATLAGDGDWIGCWGRGDGRTRRFGAALVGRDGTPLWTATTPGRGHGLTLLPSLTAVAVSQRRPGVWVTVLGLKDGSLRATIKAPDARIFSGHAAIAATETNAVLLATAESDAEDGMGVLGLWRCADAAGGNWRRVGEMTTGGVEPHDLLIVGDRIYIAHGGLRQTAESGRRPADMREEGGPPSDVTALSWPEGRVLARARAPAGLSLRHLAWDGRAAHVGAQAQPGADPNAPLLYRLNVAEDDAQLVPWPMTPEATRRLAGYVGSVAAGPGGRLAASSPRGGAAVLMSGDAVSVLPDPDVCALAFDHQGLVLASGAGVSRRIGWKTADVAAGRRGALLWDNHAISTRPAASLL